MAVVSQGPGVRRMLAAGLAMACAGVAGGQGPAIVVAPPGQANAQAVAPPPAQPTGMITGRVIAEDTQHAARFATVMMFPVQQPSSGDSDQRRRRLPWINARTMLDGTFTASGQPGDYYVQAAAPGYLSLQGVAQEAVAAGQTPDQILGRLPVVHVTADGIAQVTVTMQRGATVSGQLQWEDGTPASGVFVTLVQATPVQLPDQLQNMPTFDNQRAMATDDRGRFRLTGIPAGSYILQANLNTRFPAAQFSPLVTNVSMNIYSPGVMRKSEATVLKITRGEERDDVRMTLDLGKLHTVTGHVSGMASGSTGGSIFVRDSQEQTLSRMGTVLPDGTFKLLFVPSGTYTVAVSARSSGANGYLGNGGRPGRGGGVSSSAVQQSLTVGDTDVSGLEFTLPAPGTAAPTLGSQ